MKSPFPGMDPFIEARGVWTDFHDNLIVEIQRMLNERLPDSYEALIGERTYIDLIEADRPATHFVVKPDVRIDGSENINQAEVAAIDATSLATSVLMHPQMSVPQREPYLEIRRSDFDEEVITCMEVLSPTNKRPGNPGWAEYERKRQLMMQGAANFVELDLLRGGRRRPWPSSPYYLLVMWKDRAPECRVWPAFVARTLPSLPIPLAKGEPNLSLDLQQAVDQILARARYLRRLRYCDPIDPPLSDEERSFLAK